MIIAIIIVLIILDTYLIWQYIRHKKMERQAQQEADAQQEARSDDFQIRYGYFKAQNTITNESQYISMSETAMDDLCFVRAEDDWYHVHAECLHREYSQYRSDKLISVEIMPIERAKLKGRKICPLCAYNKMPYSTRLEYELQEREYIKTTLVGSSGQVVQSYLESIMLDFEFRYINQNRIYFDYEVENDRVAAVILSNYSKDEYGDYAIYEPYPNRVIIGYLPAALIKKINILKDEFENLTGLLKDVYVNKSKKLCCEIVIYIDKSDVDGFEFYKKTAANSEE